jgi:ubiquitin carboxyl-terminal hydrolase L3
VSYILTSSAQDRINDICQGKTPEERAKLLATTTLFADIHAESAGTGQSAPTVDTDLHFTCFVEAPDADFRKAAKGEGLSEDAKGDKVSSGMRLIELDGRRAGPVDHGECKDLLTVGCIISQILWKLCTTFV